MNVSEYNWKHTAWPDLDACQESCLIFHFLLNNTIFMGSVCSQCSTSLKELIWPNAWICREILLSDGHGVVRIMELLDALWDISVFSLLSSSFFQSRIVQPLQRGTAVTWIVCLKQQGVRIWLFSPFTFMIISFFCLTRHLYFYFMARIWRNSLHPFRRQQVPHERALPK